MKRFTFVLVAILTLALSSNGFAEKIMFLHSGTGSGTIGETSFTDAAFTITAIGDTDNRYTNNRVCWINHDSASILIEDVGSFRFISGTRTFFNSSNKTPGFSRTKTPGVFGTDLYDGPWGQLPADWEMLTAIGPVTDSSFMLIQWSSSPLINTDGGTLRFNTQDNITGSFQAIMVPEPSTLILLSMGVLGLALFRRRQKS